MSLPPNSLLEGSIGTDGSHAVHMMVRGLIGRKQVLVKFEGDVIAKLGEIELLQRRLIQLHLTDPEPDAHPREDVPHGNFPIRAAGESD
jgi:hypothetical protein